MSNQQLKDNKIFGIVAGVLLSVILLEYLVLTSDFWNDIFLQMVPTLAVSVIMSIILIAVAMIIFYRLNLLNTEESVRSNKVRLIVLLVIAILLIPIQWMLFPESVRFLLELGGISSSGVLFVLSHPVYIIIILSIIGLFLNSSASNNIVTVPVKNNEIDFRKNVVPTNKKKEELDSLIDSLDEIKSSEPVKVVAEKEIEVEEKVAAAELEVTEILEEAPQLVASMPDSQKTVAHYDLEEENAVVGWLIGVSGPHYGEDFVLKEGKNNIGRGIDMDVVIHNDKTVSRDKHVVLISDANNRKFYLQAGLSKGLVYLNGEIVMSHAEIKESDVVQLGKSKFYFKPLVGDEFTWKNYKA